MLAYIPSEDPLFQKMTGHWRGHGTRTMMTSGRRIQIETDVQSLIQGDRLVSRNQIRETAGDSSSKTYVKAYWLQNTGDGQGHYRLGSGNSATSTGYYEGSVFYVTQVFGGEPPLKVESSTEFQETSSIHRERLLQGDRVLTETRIQYTLER